MIHTIPQLVARLRMLDRVLNDTYERILGLAMPPFDPLLEANGLYNLRKERAVLDRLLARRLHDRIGDRRAPALLFPRIQKGGEIA